MSKKRKFMIVKWMDASSEHEWKDAGDSVHESIVCWTSGWFIDEKDGCLVLAQTVTSDDGWGNEWKIPVGCILRRRVVRGDLP